MTGRRQPRDDRQQLLALLGLVTVLVVAVIGYVSYHALNGLPLQARYRVGVDVPSANRVLPTADVRIAGVRVGQVEHVTPRPGAAGEHPYAHVVLALEPSAGPLPADTTVAVRPASVLGATYVDLTPGRSTALVRDGGALPLANARPTVELTDLFSIFDRSTARNMQATLREFAGGLAGRGTAVNATIASLSGLVGPLRDVASAVGAPRARLAGFIRAYASAAQAFSPVAPQLAGLFAGGATTFGARVSERASLVSMIETLPGAESSATAALQRTRPAFAGLVRLSDELRPATRLLPRALARANAALAAGGLALRAVPPFSDELGHALGSLTAFARMPSSARSLAKLNDLFAQFKIVLDLLTPAQVHCNVIALAGQDFSSYTGVLGSGDGPSMWNFVLDTSGAQTDGVQAATPAPDLKLNYVPHESASECEANNEPATGAAQAFGNPPGLQPAGTRATTPPPGALDRARAAGLIGPVRGAP